MKSRGQTLAEVLVATVVLGVGLVAVMKAFGTCSRTVGIIRGQTVAKNFASRMMSEARGNPALLLSEDEGALGREHPGFAWSRRLRETPEPGVIAVRITVTWRTRGVRREYSLVSLAQSPRF